MHYRFFCQILQRSEGWDQPFITMSNVIKCGRHYGTERKFLSATLTNIILEIEFFIHFFHGIVFVRGIGVTVPRLWLRIFLSLQEKKSVKSVQCTLWPFCLLKKHYLSYLSLSLIFLSFLVATSMSTNRKKYAKSQEFFVN